MIRSKASRIKQLEWDVTYLKAQVANLLSMSTMQNEHNELTDKRIKLLRNTVERLDG